MLKIRKRPKSQGFKQWQTDFNRTVNKGAKAIRIAAPIIKKLTPAEQKASWYHRWAGHCRLSLSTRLWCVTN